MQKNSYRFNFVQRSDIVIFCYCSICLPTCNSEMFHILCRCIRTHVPISNVLYSLQFYICTCLITQLFWQKMPLPCSIWGSICCILQSIAPCHLYDLNKIIQNYHVLLFTLSSKEFKRHGYQINEHIFLRNEINKYTLFRTTSNHNASHMLSKDPLFKRVLFVRLRSICRNSMLLIS